MELVPHTLRSLPLFETFSDEQLAWLVAHASVEEYQAGEHLFDEGQPVEAMWVLIEGEWRLSQLSGGFDLTLVVTSQPGTWAGGMPLVSGVNQLSTRVTRSSRFLRIPVAEVEYMLGSGFPIATHLLAGITIGARKAEGLRSQHEKLTALGKLSAGLAHELNNPAAAARRAAAGLQRAMQDQQEALLGMLPPGEQAIWRPLLAWMDAEMIAATAEDPEHVLDGLARADREDAICAWFDGHGLEEGYDAATALVEVGLDATWLDSLESRAPQATLASAVRWAVVAATGLALGRQVEQSTGHISDLVEAVKSYSYMDEAPLQEIDVHDGLESTLVMFSYQLKAGIQVVRDYDADLPRILAYGSELNQVWTNLIDNAIDAMGEEGLLTIRTAREEGGVLVEIGDSGSGIAPEVLPHIFEPFFTTKGVGEGTGLGLDVSYGIVVAHHRGNIQVSSAPGDTRFQVRLPLHGDARV